MIKQNIEILKGTYYALFSKVLILLVRFGNVTFLTIPATYHLCMPWVGIM